MVQNFKFITLQTIALALAEIFVLCIPHASYAFPIYAQQAYENPREANGRIVCANCHLAQKPVKFETSSAVLPNDIFKVIAHTSSDVTKQQILGNGLKGGQNIGAVVILPEGFKLAPKSRLNDELKEKLKGVYITPYSSLKENILIVGPISGEKNKEIVFPILAPDPTINKKVTFGKYPVYIGINRGRAQIDPTGKKTNNNAVSAIVSGKITDIQQNEKDSVITFLSLKGDIKIQAIPKVLALTVKKDQSITQDELLTENPNVGGFGQANAEIILQNPARVYGYTAFCASVVLAQSMLVFKKKQFEKVQAAELDF